jgi:hypothetical protein
MAVPRARGGGRFPRRARMPAMYSFPDKLSLLRPLALAATLGAAAPAAHGCSVCGCSLSSDWASQGYGMSPGLEAGVNYQYYDQDVLRAGTGEANRAAYTVPNDHELQKDTLTRSTTLGIDYVASPAWGFDLQLPYYDRYHSTVAPGDTELSESRASGVGDARVSARFQKFDPSQSYGLQFGLKLATGQFNQDFAAGPQAGSLLDRGLQLGTGTTDLFAGLSYFGRPAPFLGFFAQATLQQALAPRDGFLPSTTLNLNLGARYLNTSVVTPMLQVNARWDGRERGVNADYANSGDAAFYVSPGATVQLGVNRSLFAFLELPVFQRVNGLQLDPRWLVSVGLRWGL